ncbi:hypothetical protein [Evansella cellulosilytica]|uniref:Uncharacterized protein n=1 Tax=Evansella cellulosilytica (strain ATCC 21833 / DSM 2522 / FERM P-1141 / JCM 9156 / N-4) TaxID=649639 RepID=E6TWX9_EVAC2|nr:hypothetical protein [Evansella cellulosilytica]ADU29929.1 hypothetical protein Bcell_1666 [Evansella cellulosilytica DSM 2522]
MKQHRIVLFLPLAVMIGLFIFGYITFTQTPAITNEELVNHIEFTVDTNAESDGSYSVDVTWHWTDFPQDGLSGDDFIEIILLNGEMESVQGTITSEHLLLHQSEDIIYDNNVSTETDNGIAMRFPNEMRDNEMLGPRGNISLYVKDALDDDIHYVQAIYYHTWGGIVEDLPHHHSIVDFLGEQEGLRYWDIQRTSNIQ